MPARPPAHDAFCRIVRCSVGGTQLDALSGPHGRGRKARQAALEQAVMTSAWSRAMPGEPASEWVRIVQPIDPGLEDLEPDRQLLVLVAGLRRDLALRADRGEADARAQLESVREGFGEPHRAEIMGVLAQAHVRSAAA
ncbi:MAG: hypothetical protein KDC33_07950 [Thermoleophilia bacterium]|nr:hypothetical protein [Thermoleophilia bacterium]